MNKSKKVLACISTPLQYINLLELIDKLNVSHSNCVVVINSKNKNTLNQINDIFSIKEWEKIITPYTLNSKLWIISHIWLRILFYKYNRRVKIVGNISDIKNRFLLNINNNSSYVVDDGANSILFEKFLNEKLPMHSKQLNSLIESKLFKEGRKLKNTNFTFYTVYPDLELNSSIHICKNEFSRLKRNYSLNISNIDLVDEFWFVGAHFVKLGMIEQNTYKKILKLINAFAQKKNLKFIYFGHRSELQFDKSLFDNIEVRSNLMPFEIYVMKSIVKPRVIASFYSSSLFNLKYFNDDIKLISFNLLNDKILTERSNKDSLKTIYQYIKEKTDIELINISDLNNF